MQNKMKVIIVDDEPLSQKGIKKYIEKTDFLELIGICDNAFEAMQILEQKTVDVLLLDIEMPNFTGIQLLKSLATKPLTIIISAYSEFALDGYNLDVIDYLVKPVSYDRFYKALNKAHEYYSLKKMVQINDTLNYLFVKTNKKIEKVYFDDILYVEALHNYVAIYVLSGKIITYQTLKSIETQLPKNKFVRVQRSFIVAVEKVNAIETNKLIIANQSISVSRTIKKEVLQSIKSMK
jgi:DNA-binding LytR/AlgR family response regulator